MEQKEGELECVRKGRGKGVPEPEDVCAYVSTSSYIYDTTYATYYSSGRKRRRRRKGHWAFRLIPFYHIALNKEYGLKSSTTAT